MKLVKCRKCGTAVMTDDTLLETMVDEMNECNRLSRTTKDPSKRNSYLQQASQLKKMVTQIQHRTTEMETRKYSNLTTLARLKAFVVENNLMTWDQINEIEDKAIAESKLKDKKDSEDLEKIYGSYRNSMVNRTNKDTTARQAFKNI